ncbi:MAG: chemotaxis protein [Desulfurobacteriaceae bacterium]
MTTSSINPEVEIVEFQIYELLEDGNIYEWSFGINSSKVKEILPKPKKIVKTPATNDILLGISEIRGETIPIISLPKWLKVKEPENIEKHLLVLEFLNQKVGIVIHYPQTIKKVKWEKIIPPPPALEKRLSGKVIGIIEGKDSLILLLDFEGILEEIELLKNVEEIKKATLKSPKETEEAIVLIVEDSPVAAKIMKKAVEGLGKKVLISRNGIEGLKILNSFLKEAESKGKNVRNYIQVIICDIEMPKMDGLTFIEKIKKHPLLSKIPVIINTSLCDRATITKSQKVKADAYIVKFDLSSLIKAIHDLTSKEN